MYNKAIKLFESINAASPNNAILKYYTGLIYYIYDDDYKAKTFLKEAIEIDPLLNNPNMEKFLNDNVNTSHISFAKKAI